MNKKISTFALAGFVLLLAFSALSSAYSNYNNDYETDYYDSGNYYDGYNRYGGYSPYEDIDRVDYHYSRDNGNMIKTTDYHKMTYSDILPDGTRVKRLAYVRETRETPYGYGYYYEPYYRTNYRYGDPSYYRTNYRYGYW